MSHTNLTLEELVQFRRLLIKFGRSVNDNARDKGFWDEPRSFAHCLMLVVSELGEAVEGDRKQKMDEHLPKYTSSTVEMADAIIRLMDMATEYCGIDLLASAIVDKATYNRSRPRLHGARY